MKRPLAKGLIAAVILGTGMIAAIAVLHQDYDLNTRITLSAPPDRVWQVLNDFQKYPEWNPHLRAVDGQPEANRPTRLREIFAGGSDVVRRIGMKSMATDYEFIWEGDLSPVPLMLTAKRKLIMTPSGLGGTSLRHEIEFRGWLSGPLSSGVFSRYAQSMQAMNGALAQRVAQTK